MRTRTTPATLWVGDRLSFMEVLSLKSLVDVGMTPTLFSYDEVRNVPDGVEVADAARILPRDRIFINKERDSLAPFSDLWRYRMLAETDHHWVDADVVALKLFEFEDDYHVAWFPPVVAIGVLSLPKSSPTLIALNKVADGDLSQMPWLATRRNRAPVYGSVAELPYKALGPSAVSWLMKRHDELDRVWPSGTHYPIYPRHILKPASRILRVVDFSESYSIHLYASIQSQRLRDAGLSIPPAGSFLDHLLREAEIDPNDYPLALT